MPDKKHKIFTKREESDDDDGVSKEEVLEDIKNIITDSRLIHLLTDQISETYVKRCATRSDSKRGQYDDEIAKMADDKRRLYERILTVQTKYSD